ncbi:hypothetical protein DLM45_08860 [Hyphomicrobium methylovorum]|uniref:hypothetical protein n=1 Tax=Hyphomicrobium methylovorum TaxID=84 RepID=UPI0015E7DA8E|nr:hypothetical protein [Hyphomicrobium methylovorum]MBA2126333.1 hypothetical protein [Hyphomicrobium methylovorum]
MAFSANDTKSLLSHDEYEVVKASNHPFIYDLDKDALRNLAQRLEGLHNKEKTFARQKQREIKGTADKRGKSFPGTADHPARRKQVFAQALKRVKKERSRLYKLEVKNENIEAAHRALALHRANKFSHHPSSDATPNAGQKDTGVTPKRRRIPGAKIGSILKQNARAQAKRDARA